MPALLIGLVILGIGLASSLASILHLSKQNALLKEKLTTTQEHLETQNKQIQALELDVQKYKNQKPQQAQAIQKRYAHLKSHQLKTCEQKLEHINRLLEVFKSSAH
ncbi:hypothetical protein NHP200010_11530 [Helicobacter bizzozeronii]|uniref:hypothetical protein n=1 Tax=Helicobacter bizzozeronii TaxID=56877 RepID=UPI00244D9393|nr:hypothetical protein [Helicobacter bizzozeronii]GMB93434.1 hypothetical protein NHP200010_11530 [Helicobacter bizzozeronii]